MKVAILDGYIDEPSSLGVPPFISPIVRYAAGAIIDAGHEVVYTTIDRYRAGGRSIVASADLLVVIAGVSVPGKYIRGMPASLREVVEATRDFKGPSYLIGHMTSSARGKEKGKKDAEVLGVAFDRILTEDGDASLFDDLEEGLCGAPPGRKRTDEEWRRWSVKGAVMVGQHPDHPQPLIAEVDVYKGCPRFHSGGCSFCSEILLGPPRFREPEDVAAEVGALASGGVTNFRLACPCIVSYKADGIEKGGRLVPRPQEVERLLIAVRKTAPDLRVLHVDNADPGVIARSPDEAREVLEHLVRHCTSGNLLSLGMESADPRVIEENHLNSTPEEVLSAIRIVNDVGGGRGPTGLPHLLPGLNFIAGLEGETSATYKMDLDFLRRVLDEGLLLRRINIRQVLEHRRRFPGVRKRKDFMRFKTAVRNEVDRPMLEKLLPRGTVLRDLYVERREGNTVFARQVGTYPILVGLPAPVPDGMFDAAIVDWGMRSVTAVPYPLDIDRAPLAHLSALPGIGRKRAARLVRARPFADIGAIRGALDDGRVLDGILTFLGPAGWQ